MPGIKQLHKFNPLADKNLDTPLTEEEKMMIQIVDKLGTSFATPEQMIIKQDDQSNEMFFIISGDCSVSVLNNDRSEYQIISED